MRCTKKTRNLRLAGRNVKQACERANENAAKQKGKQSEDKKKVPEEKSANKGRRKKIQKRLVQFLNCRRVPALSATLAAEKGIKVVPPN